MNNRQAGRRRGRGGNNGGGGNGPRPNGGGGQRDSGNRIDSRARGNANQLYEKYKNLAADAQRQGDRVNTEYYLQFADHYFRVLSETRSRYEEQNPQRPRRDDGFDAQPFTGSFDSGFDGQDDEYSDEGEPIRAGEQRLGEQAVEEGEERPERFDRGNERQNGAANGNAQPRRDDRPREERPRDDRPRDDRPRDDRPREERPRREGFEGERAPREQSPRDQGPREDGRRPRRYRDEGVSEAAPRPAQAEAPEVVAPAAVEAPTEVQAQAEAPRRRGRPRREQPSDEAPAAFDAALLPPSLGILPAAPAAEAAEGEAKPRRRRVRAVPADEATPAS